MASALFFTDNQARYNRVMQLSNNIGTIKGLCAQSYDAMSKEEDFIDAIRDQTMKERGFKTLQEYQQSIADTLPDDARKAYTHLIDSLQDADVALGKASSVLTAVMAAAGGTLVITGGAKKLVEILSEGVFRAEFARGFKLFVKGELKEGLRVMRGVSKWAKGHYEYLGELAPAARSARAVRLLKVFNSVLEFVAKWAFIIDIAVLFTQFTVEKEQRTEMMKAIHDFFCQRFSLQKQMDEFKATERLYTRWHAFVQTKSVMDASSAIPEDAKNLTLKGLADSFMDSHQKELDAVTDEAVWKECEDYDKLDTTVYHDGDPDLAEVKRWLDEQAAKDPEDITKEAEKK